MRKVILSMMVSLDGFIEEPNRDINWHIWSEEMNHFMGEFFQRVDTILFGRHTYELMLSYWPSVTNEDPVITDNMNNLPKIVFSRTLNKVEWKSTLIKENISGEIKNLKHMQGKDMVIFGGANLASSFIEMGLIDEYQIIINPVVLGRGTPLFQEMDQILNLKLIEAQSFRCGNVVLKYEPKKKDLKIKITSKIEKVTSELLQLITSLSEEQLNRRPLEGSWSAGQVGDHLLRSYGVLELLQGKTKPTERAIDEKVQKLKSIFLDFEVKLASPEFIVPSEKNIAKDDLVNALREKITGIVNFSKQNDLSETCLDFELPGMGLMTKLEWMHFVTYHSQRHIHQLKNIIISLKKTVSA